MIESTIISYLTEKLNVKTVAEVPKTMPNEFIVIERVGGGSANHISRATVAIQSYSTTLAKAAELNDAMKSAMAEMVELDNISSVRFSADYNYTDTSTDRYRYQATFDVVYFE